MHPRVWEASGHLERFTDPMVDCRECKRRFRADHLDTQPWLHYCPAKKDNKFEIPAGEACKHCGAHRTLCPVCGKGELTEPRQFNMMLKTFLGPVEEAAAVTYLRPETAQGMFVNLENVLQAMRRKLPFGIAQIGRSFRNEITPGNFIFRTREFEQMEMEYFVKPGEDEELHQYWIDTRTQWYIDLGIDPANLRHYEHPKEKLSHYSKRTVDIEYRFGFSARDFEELEGIANRTDFDLSQHSEFSGQDLSYFDQASGERYMPYVIEPAAGLTRSLMAFLIDAYHEDEAPNTKGGVDKRTVLRLDPRIAPVKAAVLPLSRNPELSPKAKALAADLRRNWNVDFDDSGAIGRRYRRQDEIGTPYCVTVDFESLDDNAVTVRERDTMSQERISMDQITSYFAERFVGC
jgi:glycyl-tRNA synthetase